MINLCKREENNNALSRDTRKEQSLLHKLIISPYIHRYKRFPKENEIQSLLSKSNKMLYLEEEHRIKNLQKLQENITYDNDGYPVDAWGNHFQYKILQAKGTSTYDYVVLFSFGPDGVESKDDIRSSIHQGLPNPIYDENHQIKNSAMNTMKSINLLTSLLSKYQYKYKKVANIAESKELFKKHNKFNIQLSDRWGNLSTSNLHYIKDEPVDAWNRPFIYDSDKNYPIIYSLGEDGIKSADDIKRKMYRPY